MTDTFVLSFTHLKDRPKAEDALKILQRIASLVKPIMRKYAWKLPVLAEFFPESANLLGLNVNRGQKILVRLRPASAPDTFYDEEDILHTMLHELTHNVHGPHDEKFYKFLSGLEEEYEALKRSGYAGEGFHSSGHRLGQGISHDISPHLSRQRALDAAEKRRKVGGMMAGGGRLGGGVRNAGLSPRELAAAAAERRMRDDRACGQGDAAQREATKATQQSVRTEALVIDLTGDSDDSDDGIIVDQPPAVGSCKLTVPVNKRPAASTAIHPTGSTASSSALNSAAAKIAQSSSVAEWQCSTCTLLNSQRAAVCAACDTPRPRIRPAPLPRAPAVAPISLVPSIGAQAPPASYWACSLCTLKNPISIHKCLACDAARQRPDEATTSTKPFVAVSAGAAPDMGWACLVCGEAGMPRDFWSCRFCGSVKTHS